MTHKPTKYNICNIRNFSIIAHIDHGKSTLSDRIIDVCRNLSDREKKDRMLDSMDLEQEKGITIKSQSVRLEYKAKDEQIYILNLMDTPGHVDFSYEVNRSLYSVEGSILLVDATQGVEAQTLANAYKAIEVDNEILVALSKIDLPTSCPSLIKDQIENIIGIDAQNAIEVSGKTGEGVTDLIEQIIYKIPHPKGDIKNRLQVLLIDSWYDTYLGVVILVKVLNGQIQAKDRIKMINRNATYEVVSVGIFLPEKLIVNTLRAGEIGFIIANIRNINDCMIGDTIVHSNDQITEALSGFKPIQQVVFCSIYPIDGSMFDHLKESIAKLSLNDSSFSFEQESSSALGLGFRCGFLGMLHMEIIQERLSREFNIDLITTTPSVIYKIKTKTSNDLYIHNVSEMPVLTNIQEMYEPWIRATIFTPDTYLGNILQLCNSKRGRQVSMDINNQKVFLQYDIPLNEIIFDFYDRLKNKSSGYASLEWELIGYEKSDLVCLRILLNNIEVPELSTIIHRTNAEKYGRRICLKLKDVISRQMFEVRIQAAIYGKIIASEKISAFRKDVTAKCYGGDFTRKAKLLKKQAKGKKRMRQFGTVEISQSDFFNVLKHLDN